MKLFLSRAIKTLAVLSLGLYLLAAGYLYSSQRRLMYFPLAAEATTARPISFSMSGLRLRGWVVNPGKSRAVLYFGGNGERVESRADFFAKALPGQSVYLLAYRGYSGNPGQPSEAMLFSDALAEFDAIAGKHASVDVIGRSLGSGVASHVASLRPVRRLVLVTPFDSAANVAQSRYPMFPIKLLLKDKYESWRRAPMIRAKTLVLVAGHDEVIPRANTDFLVSRFPTSPDVVVFPESGHNTISAEENYAVRIGGFLGVPDATGE